MSKIIFADGQCILEYSEDGVYLTVDFTVGKKEMLMINVVMEKLSKKKVSAVEFKAIEEIFKTKDVERRWIAPYQNEVLFDALANITVSENKLKAFIEIMPPEGGKNLNREDILRILEQNRIKEGIDEGILENLVLAPRFNEKFCIASGKEPVNGINGKLEIHFNTYVDRRPKILEDGRVDYKELNFVQSVKEGEKLATAIPPIPGKSGVDVYGNLLKALDGKPVVLPKGKNVEVSQDGASLLSKIEGCIEYIDGKINILQQFEIPENVDASTGNVYFVGNIHVKGDVLTGYVIEAEGSIVVEGIVEAASLKAGGDVVLKKGISGRGKGKIIAGNNVISKYIENSNVEAGNMVQAEVIMHSNIKAGEKIELIGKKGLMVGGEISAGHQILANTIGCSMGTATIIEVGQNPYLREKYKVLKGNMDKKEDELEKLHQMAESIMKLKEQGRANPQKIEMLTRLLKGIGSVKEELTIFKNEKMEIEEGLREAIKGEVKIKNNVYPGTKVFIGNPSISVDDILGRSIIHRNGEDVTIIPWKV
jgi:uncharacterized protein (DUF342 family)